MALNTCPARHGFRMMIVLLILAGTAFLLASPVFAATAGTPGDGNGVITINASGSRSYYLGERVFLSGRNAASDTTYLFMTGPNMPDSGGKITSSRQAAVTGNPDT